MRRLLSISDAEIIADWDRLAGIRDQQISSKKDVSFHYVLAPTILEMVKPHNTSSVLDVGCGVGHLCRLLAGVSAEVVGVDFSPKSVAIAKRRVLGLSNVQIHESTIEHYAEATEKRFTLAICNMGLMTTTHLNAVIASVSSLLSANGIFIFTITHPCFWPIYWQFNLEPWYTYREELIIEAPFRISNDQENSPVMIHVHRPLETYLTTLMNNSFELISVLEPMPSPDVQLLYPEPWTFPRFLACKYRLNRSKKIVE